VNSLLGWGVSGWHTGFVEWRENMKLKQAKQDRKSGDGSEVILARAFLKPLMNANLHEWMRALNHGIPGD
jgi:hypothetical protein